jgi:hypothetical protein
MWRMGLALLLKRVSAGLGEKEAKPADSRFRRKTSTIATLYTRPPDNGLKISPKHVEAWQSNFHFI